MGLIIFETPAKCEEYLLVGEYNGCPIYVGPNPPREWAAMDAGKRKGVCLNQDVYKALERSPDFIPFLETICEYVMIYGPIHEAKKETMTKEDEKVLEFLRKRGFLE